ncbi:MAG: hypothetical protein U5R49_20765 [Deltaproteobacteria bacterium]|nr:hypothetical protein [Deltaproteobacteria bacterium]
MKLKEQTKRSLDGLEPKALAEVYDLIMELRRAAGPKQRKTAGDDYLKVREALKPCKGSLTDDILMEREERI